MGFLAEAAAKLDGVKKVLLADALAYGIATYSPKAVIDLATLYEGLPLDPVAEVATPSA